MSRHTQQVLLADRDVTIESWEVQHIAAVAPWLRPDAEWKQWDAPYLPGPTEQVRAAWVNQMYADPWQRDPVSDWPMRLPLCLRGEAVGSMSWTWQDRGSGWIRIGIVVYDPSLWGQGIGTTALRLWVDWLSTHPDAYRIDLTTWSGNQRMIRAARSIGMTDEAWLSSARVVGGRRHASVVIGLTRHDDEDDSVGPPSLGTVER